MSIIMSTKQLFQQLLTAYTQHNADYINMMSDVYDFSAPEIALRDLNAAYNDLITDGTDMSFGRLSFWSSDQLLNLYRQIYE